MSTLIAITASGVFQLERSGARPEKGPSDVTFTASDGESILAVSRAGVLWQRDAHGGWRQLAERTVPDEIWSFGADARLPGRLYLGVSPALVYRSDDRGETWTACESLKSMPGYETWTFPPPPHIPHVRSIAIDPERVGGLYIGVEEGGVYRSPDGGDTWEGLNDGLYWDVHNVRPAADGEELYATTGAGFHRSDDAGQHWGHVTQGIAPHRYTMPLLLSQTSGRLFTAAAAGPPPTWSQGVNGALFRSDDAGRSWQRLLTGLPPQFERMPAGLIEDDSGRVAIACGGDVFLSDDAGDHWSTIADGLPPVRALVAV